MVEPEKPFACSLPECGMTFTNEDHLHVHTKKHDMVLQFGCEQKAAFVADQTPTPTRFIRNCEEVGLFQDLQNVNPFDEGFKRAMETKVDLLTLESTIPALSEELHTPQMFPLLDPGDSVFSATNHRNITISRSSSDENGVKEFETTTISKLTNEVTTISRIVEKVEEPRPKEGLKCSLSYNNNVVKVHSNVELKTHVDAHIQDTIIKDRPKDISDRLQVDAPTIMSQKSIDNVVDSLTTDFITEARRDDRKDKRDQYMDETVKESKNYEVILKLPSGQQVKLINVDDKPKTAKDMLKKVLTEKVQKPQIINNYLVPSVIPSGTLIPVSLVNTTVLPKLPLRRDHKSVKRKSGDGNNRVEKQLKDDAKVLSDLDSRSAASKRYRARLKETMIKQAQENNMLKEINERLVSENETLKAIIIEHMRTCPNIDDLRELQASILKAELKN